MRAVDDERDWILVKIVGPQLLLSAGTARRLLIQVKVSLCGAS